MPPLPGVGNQSRLFEALFAQQQARQQESQFDDQQTLRKVALGLQGADLLAGNIQQERQRGFEAGEAGLEREFRGGQAEQLAAARLAEIDAQQGAISERAGLDRALDERRVGISEDQFGLNSARFDLDALGLAEDRGFAAEEAENRRARLALEERRVGLSEREFEFDREQIKTPEQQFREEALLQALQTQNPEIVAFAERLLSGEPPAAPVETNQGDSLAEFFGLFDPGKAFRKEFQGGQGALLSERAANRRNRAPQFRTQEPPFQSPVQSAEALRRDIARGRLRRTKESLQQR